MTEIPKQQNFYWLFADTVGDKTYKYDEFVPEFETNKGKKLPVFQLFGEDNKGNMGDFLVAIWNITNLEEIKKKLGSDDATWKDKLFKFRPDDKQPTKLVMIPEI